jgi:putative membrane protein insertion efficiency factor
VTGSSLSLVSRAAARAIAAALTGLISVYRVAISPSLRPACRFLPTCSRYALDAIRERGPIIGMALAARRLLRCHPFGGFGVDLVPLRRRH